MRLLLVRHGQTPHNVAGALDTAFPGAALTALGRRQADAVPGALVAEPVAGVFASPLVRTQLTAAPLAAARGLEVDVRPGLEEISAGELELRSDEEAVQDYLACAAAWMAGDLDHALPGGGTGHAFLERYGAAVAGIADSHGEDATVAVFSHGAAIRVFATVVTGLDPDEAADLRLRNTGMVVLDGTPERWTLTQWHTAPLGGVGLTDEQAHDVTGEAPDEAVGAS